ncbi:MAG: hypothetical protein ABI563_19530 [Specibacter sp.]
MIAIVTLLAAFPLGALVRSRAAAFGIYSVAYLWAFVFQSVYLLLYTMSGGNQAFNPEVFPLDYGLVAAGVFTAGLLLVLAGSHVGRRVRSRRSKATAHA